MSEATWLPGIIVLGAGLFIGLSLAFRLRAQSHRRAERQADTANVMLQIRDLEARRDDLYRRIRSAEEENVGTEEIAALEDAAAMTLRQLDRLESQLPKATRRKREHPDAAQAPEAAASAPSAEPAPAKARARNPLLVGFAFGAAMVAIVALLVFWAVEDAQPTAPMGAQTGSAGQPPHESQQEIPPELAAQITDLESRLMTDPGDLMARKQLALTYVASGQLFEAFNNASQVLEVAPEDPDGLLVHGIVRLAMGQADQAVGILDQVLAQHPDHRQALIYRGLALYQTGRVEQALDTWDMGLQMAGGSDPEFEELILMAQSGASQPAGMTAPVSSPTAAPAPGPTPSATPVSADPEAYTVTIDLAAGVSAAPQATLFVFLRPADGGPPVAANRVATPRFPVSLRLGIDDSMMGGALPARGILVARLDADGNVASADAGDLQVEAEASLGGVVRMTLGE